MSDVFEGPGWWMASDGKWYPPHLHADASYRARWVNAGAVVATPDTSQTVLTADPAVQTVAETRTSITEPVGEHRNGRPVADVPPQNGTAFVTSDRVAERAAALADTARTEPPATTAPVVSTPAPLQGEFAPAVPDVAAPSETNLVPPVPQPAAMPADRAPTPTAPAVEAPTPAVPAVEAPPVEPEPQTAAAPVSMPEPVVEPHDSSTPLRSVSASDGFVGFGAPSSTPVSEILNRLTDEDFGRLTPPDVDDEDDVRDEGSAESIPGPGPTDAQPPEPDTDPAAEPAAPAEPERLVSVAPPAAPDTDVRVGPAVEEAPSLEPIEFEPAETVEFDAAAVSSRARLEVGTPADRGEERFGLLTPNRPTEQRITLQEQAPISSSTDLVPVAPTEIAVYADGPTLHDRLVASVLFLSGVALIVGTFLVWTTAAGTETTGWDMTDGIATVVAGVLGSAAAGPIFVGFRHIIPKSVAIVCGLVGIVVPGLHGLEALSDSDLAQTGVGTGFWVVLGGAVAMLLAGVADQSRFGD